METVPYSRLPESHGRHVTKVRISEAIGKAKAALEKIVLILVFLPVESILVLLWFRERRELIWMTVVSKTWTFMFSGTHKEREAKKRREREEQSESFEPIWKLFQKHPAIEAKKPKEWDVYRRRSTLKQIALLEPKKNTASYFFADAIQHTAPAPGAPCDDGTCVPPSTQMPEALPSNDPAPVGGSSDDDPNGIESQSDESSRATEASPAHPPAITPSNGASPPIREDDSERREPPVPRDIESQRDGNGDSEAIPKEVLLMFALQAFQILSNVKSNGISLLSRRAEIVQYCAEALTVIGFFCGLGVILLRNDRNLRAATNIMSRIGFYFTGLGLIATLCVSLGKFMFWILGFFCFLFSAIYAYALWKGWIV